MSQIDYELKEKSMIKQCSQNYLLSTKSVLIQTLKELEELQRDKQKEFVAKNLFKIGRKCFNFHGSTLTSNWEEGEEIKKLLGEIKEIKRLKEDLQKERRKLKNSDEIEENRLRVLFYSKEESKLEQEKHILNKEKFYLIKEDKRLADETNCIFSKANWPLIDVR